MVLVVGHCLRAKNDLSEICRQRSPGHAGDLKSARGQKQAMFLFFGQEFTRVATSAGGWVHSEVMFVQTNGQHSFQISILVFESWIASIN